MFVAIASLIIGGTGLYSQIIQKDDAPTESATQQVQGSQTTNEQISQENTALAALETLAVKGRAAKTGYERSRFGNGWKSVEGCDMRNRILKRDLQNPQFVENNYCLIASGTLNDPYTATVINFKRGNQTSSQVQIDHVVALSDAWQKGAQALTSEQREALANDPLELIAVDGKTNQAKGDGDAATWLPPNKNFRCEYVARQIAVKQKYSLWVTDAEKSAMKRVLHVCPAQTLPTP